MSKHTGITPEQEELVNKINRANNWVVFAMLAIVSVALFHIMAPDAAERLYAKAEVQEEAVEPVMDDTVKNGIHLGSGLIVADGFEQVKGNCLSCHSGHLIAQNRATREGWKEIIRWMQETQNLWDLGQHEATILDYLSANYAPKDEGRRANLNDIEWYELD